jgi:hypothetical protein
MYSQRAVFEFRQGTVASVRFSVLSELAAVCESVETSSGLPAFEISVGDKCSVTCYRPDKWVVASRFLLAAQERGTIIVIRPSF